MKIITTKVTVVGSTSISVRSAAVSYIALILVSEDKNYVNA